MIKTVLKFIDYMELKYRISIPKEPLIEFAKEVYHLGFSEPHTSDEQPCGNSGVFDGTCNADMNEWDY